ncbi:Cytochrome P450 76C4 [Striga hermonthica]|uniref:Cytochrome P450 76C4 n=1 Tax=Striga hermonthica TaxID=68872 RepID=A0A9N7RSC3_STRHE|nr:Cytochrome P450 76C4 [Striga hermonthica]
MVLTDYLSPLLLLISITWIFTIIILNSKARRPKNLPPGPFPLPIIGNILHLGPKPHQSLAKLSREYGPVMSLKLGAITTVVISSPEAARAVLQKHDLAFSSRKISIASESLGHDVFSMVWLPVDSQWRKLRKICREQMFSGPRLDSGQGLRSEKLGQLRGYVKSCRDSGRTVDVGEAAFTTVLNLMSATLFSKEFAGFGSGSSGEIRDVVWGVMRIIDEKLRCRGDNIKDDLLEALIELHLKGELSRDDIKHMLLDLFAAGTDTSSSTVEWAMAELLRNPSKLSTLRNEINDVINGVENDEQSVQESDIPRLPYLQAVVKETLRLHPPAPLLVPHKANVDVEWRIEEGIESEVLDMDEKFGITLQKAVPLRAVPVKP